MASSILGSLAAGLRGAGATLSPEVFNAEQNFGLQKVAQENRLQKIQFEQQQALEQEKALANAVGPYIQKGDLKGASAAAISSETPGGMALGLKLLDQIENRALKEDQINSNLEMRKSQLEVQKNSAEMMHEARMAQLTDSRARAQETERHNRSMESIAGQRLLLEKYKADKQGQDTGLDWTPEEVSAYAKAAVKDPRLLQGFARGKEGRQLLLKVGKEMAGMMIGGADINRTRAAFQSDLASLNKIVPVYDAVVSFENNAIKQGRILVDLGKQVDATGIPVYEKYLRGGKQALGDTKVANFNAQLQVYRTEVAKILTNPNLTGQLTDEARKEIEAFLKGGISAPQLQEVVKLLEGDFGRRKEALQEQMDAIRNRMSSGYVGQGTAAAEKAGQGPPPPAQGGYVEGQIYEDANGNRAIWKNGKFEEVPK